MPERTRDGAGESGICAGRVVIVTGAGRGIGREHALEFARQGARVVVNDVGVARDGAAAGEPVARTVVEEIRALGAEAVANTDDVADWDGAKALVASALAAFGRLDVLVNNAGFVRDRMIVSMTEQEWDAVVRVHLKGHAAPLRHAAAHWRDEAKAGRRPDARVINTSSGAGLQGSVGQANYGAAKAGIAALTLTAATELARYGVTANAIAPSARTRMTEGVFATMDRPESGFDAMDPANIAPLVVWLGSELSAHVTGQVFEVEGGRIAVASGWHHGVPADRGGRWDPADVGPAVDKLLAAAPPAEPVYGS
ncbi:SDR family oxidoreductase [Pseudofrankia asymbiotica]|uniref:Short-chain dehydrogenase n=1 Tax=Pseudofrankia asymbiotica TaxID=1834516 RepID=A0A1V2IJ33_9ACTN|nr:SDR family oxidoreductase [Pseudofrankia asymbiotica]ONH33127.1 short-chain dehydrogenase [Pseudofrankia asymbiotica]